MLRVLIAEDDLMIAGLLEDVLTASGYEVCGIVGTIDEAVALGKLHKPDLAVLDFRLARDGRGPEIARRLNSRGKFGVLYVTGDYARFSNLTQADGCQVASNRDPSFASNNDPSGVQGLDLST